jgi:hypothetical protein
MTMGKGKIWELESKDKDVIAWNCKEDKDII